jgi:hypothetical protein
MAKSIGESSASGLARPEISILAGAVVYLVLLAAGDRLLNDPDIYWHVVVGQWIIEHAALPHTDVFSQTFAGAPWIAKEWLSQLILTVAHASGGWAAIVIVTALATATAFVILARFLLERLPLLPALLLTSAALVLAAPHLVARPHVLALPLLVVWTTGLVRALDERRNPPLWLLPVMTVWANLHGGFTAGLALIIPVAIEAVMVTEQAARRSVALAWAKFAVFACTAACLTPYGPESILMTYRIFGLGEALSIIGEWRAQDFSGFSPFEACLLMGIGFALHRGLTLPPLRIVVVLGLLHLALAHVRSAELLAFVIPVFLAAPLAAQLGGIPAEAGGHRAQPMAAAVILAVLAAVTSSLAGAHRFLPNAEVSPISAVRKLEQIQAGPVFNDYDFGGYLIYARVSPFIDGRTDLYGGAFTARHHRAVNLVDVGDFLELLDENRIGATLLRPDTPAVGLLDRLSNWQRVYSDQVAVVHARKADDAGVVKGRVE